MGTMEYTRELPRVKVFFRWACDNVGRDEEVRVVGLPEVLGHWMPACGVPLERHKDEASCWTSKGVFLPLNEEIEYKYVICKRNARGDEPEKWEDGENRKLRPTGRQLVAEDDAGRFRDLPVAASFVLARKRTGSLEGQVQGTEGGKDDGNLEGMPRLQSFEDKLRKEQAMQTISPNDSIFAVFRTLPVRLTKTEDGSWTVVDDGDAITFKTASMIYRSIPKGANITFVGHPGVFETDPEEQRKITQALEPHKCIPVFMPEQVAQSTMEFCHSFLWPVMHNMKVFDDEASGRDDAGTAQKFEEARWKNYQMFNRAYVDAVEASSPPGSLVWIHDFYLLLMPRVLKLRRPDVAIGFFLHSAFPMSEVMRCIPTREEILQSMLSCKVVTFQIFEYARHFLSCCQLLMNATYYFQGAGVLHVEHESESVVVRADHFVLPYEDFATRIAAGGVSAQAEEIRREFGGRLLFASIDGDEPFSGMILKLRAFEGLLQECKQHVKSVALLQHVLGKHGPKNSESEVLREARRMADELNSTYAPHGPPVVVIRDGELSVDERLAILQAADVLLDTSINDGLNLHPFMFCIAHTQDERGSLIVSEFSGCSHVLVGATKINPWNTRAVIDAMNTLATLHADESSELKVQDSAYGKCYIETVPQRNDRLARAKQSREDTVRRFKQDHSYVATQRLSEFVKNNICELKQCLAVQKDAPVRGLGAGSRLHFMERGFQHLSFEAVYTDYRRAKMRAIFLDNEGTLAPDRRTVVQPYGARNQLVNTGTPPDSDVLECLKTLAKDRSNIVVVISGRSPQIMDKWFAPVRDSGVGLCAEHGFYWVPPGKLAPPAAEGPQQRWTCMREEAAEEDKDWKFVAQKLMEKYVRRVQGSVLEAKGSAVAWNYRKVGAQMLANEIAQEMMRFLDPSDPDSLMYGYPVVVVAGKGYVEVKRSDVDKGRVVDRILQEMKERFGEIDFVLCVGDDRSDEDMFEVVNQFAEQQEIEKGMRSKPDDDLDDFGSDFMASPTTVKSTWSNSAATNTNNAARGGLQKKSSLTLEEFNPADRRSQYYTVTVGRKPTLAGYFVNNPTEVSELLTKMQEKVCSLARYSSMPTLVQHDSDND